MDREILFRGKRVDGNGWVEGGIVLRANGQIFIEPIIDASQVIIYAVDPDTVGQYTGLMDRNGKRIFEGDVMEYDGLSRLGHEDPEKIRVLIAWGNGGWRMKQTGNRHAYVLTSAHVPVMTIIGNIHDNPELMEGEI